ncbi:hypothetical protein ACFSKM_24330 [Ancylobacter dichloromethanicus]|uniref:Uncharacterized protein n=1 Tax=Ancylobacter dichloromethanicus TaxID=518825 RepID=A0A9W6JCB4_9HYPH|nr:hypothetical protein [Ancylobacter dichloromethanicus]GLK73235.1 hypothetical protein GCM10017643_33520 [Ancylobacter dichloromethanicus]
MTTRVQATRAALLAGAMVCATMGAPGIGPAFAADDPPEMNLTGQLLTGLGLVAPPPPDIDYRERAPLVVPPTGDILPPPRDAAAISQNPAWPKDHDEVARQKAEATDWGEAWESIARDGNTASRTLTPSELDRGYKAGKSTGSGFANTRKNDDNRLSLNEMDFFGWGNKKDDTLQFEGEPDRESLIEPPPGYQTPAPGAKYGVVADRPEDKDWKMPSWFDRTQRNK